MGIAAHEQVDIVFDKPCENLRHHAVRVETVADLYGHRQLHKGVLRQRLQHVLVLVEVLLGQLGAQFLYYLECPLSKHHRDVHHVLLDAWLYLRLLERLVDVHLQRFLVVYLHIALDPLGQLVAVVAADLVMNQYIVVLYPADYFYDQVPGRAQKKVSGIAHNFVLRGELLLHYVEDKSY